MKTVRTIKDVTNIDISEEVIESLVAGYLAKKVGGWDDIDFDFVTSQGCFSHLSVRVSRTKVEDL